MDLVRVLEKTIIFYFLAVFLIFGGSAAYQIHANNTYYAKLEETNKRLQEMASVTEEVETSVEKADGTKETEVIPSLDMETLKANLPGCVGWIYQPGTQINYPIMWQENDDDYYLGRNPEGELSTGGSIFMDGWNNPFFQDDNTILHGHNMKDGEMFGMLKHYITDENYVKEHPVFYIYTSKWVGKYRVISAYKEMYDGEEYTRTFESREDYENFLKRTKNKSIWDTGTEYNPSAPIVTLSSCFSSGTKGVKTIVVLQRQ